jgi:site-specific recombinase XerD
MKERSLRQRTLDTLKLGNYADRTIQCYVGWIERLAGFYHLPPDQLSIEQVQVFLLHLIEKEKKTFSTVNQAMCAYRFLYREVLELEDCSLHVPARRKQTRRPIAYSKEQISALFSEISNPKHNAVLRTVYGAGLRVSEVVQLRPEHILSERGLIRVEQGKGKKDRYTVLPSSLLEPLRAYYRCFAPGEWLFFGRDRSVPMPISTAQKFFGHYRDQAGLPKVGIHTLRHSFATHYLESGGDIYRLKRMMGHSSLSTTHGYIHITNNHLDQVRSPLDHLPPPPTQPCAPIDWL